MAPTSGVKADVGLLRNIIALFSCFDKKDKYN